MLLADDGPGYSFLVLKASSIEIIGFSSAKAMNASHEIIFSVHKKSHTTYGLACENALEV